MSNLKLADSGDAVFWLRRTLNEVTDSTLPDSQQFDSALEQTVVDFQSIHGLYADGVVGDITRAALRAQWRARLLARHGRPDGLVARAVAASDVVKGSEPGFTLRADVAAAVDRVREALHASGALLTSAGGFRELGTPKNSAQSATSMHYVGRAVDLAVGSGMEKPASDCYVVVADGDRLHRVFARADQGTQMSLRAVTYASRKTPKTVSGRFVDLTSLMLEQGFQRIRARPAFYTAPDDPRSYLSAEWWHFQYQVGLLHEHTRFGEELQLVWSQTRLADSAPWVYREKTFGVDWA